MRIGVRSNASFGAGSPEHIFCPCVFNVGSYAAGNSVTFAIPSRSATSRVTMRYALQDDLAVHDFSSGDLDVRKDTLVRRPVRSDAQRQRSAATGCSNADRRPLQREVRRRGHLVCGSI